MKIFHFYVCLCLFVLVRDALNHTTQTCVITDECTGQVQVALGTYHNIGTGGSAAGQITLSGNGVSLTAPLNNIINLGGTCSNANCPPAGWPSSSCDACQNGSFVGQTLRCHAFATFPNLSPGTYTLSAINTDANFALNGGTTTGCIPSTVVVPPPSGGGSGFSSCPTPITLEAGTSCLGHFDDDGNTADGDFVDPVCFVSASICPGFTCDEVVQGSITRNNIPFGTNTNLNNWELYTGFGGVANTATGTFCRQTVTVRDTTSPALQTCPSTITVSNDSGSCGAVVTFPLGTFTDNCGISSVSASPSSGSTFSIGSTTVTHTATDNNGLSNSCTHQVIVNDNENPTLTVPADFTVVADTLATCSPTIPVIASASDNCGVTSSSYNGDVSGSGLNASGNFVAKNTYTINFTARDAAGNSVTDTTVLTVDASLQMDCPADFSRNVDSGECYATVNIARPAAENCDPNPIVITSTVGGSPAGDVINDQLAPGATTINYLADDSLTTVSCSTIVTVNDNENPTFTQCPISRTVNADAGLCSATVTLLPALADDNCAVQSISNNLSGNSNDISGPFNVGTTAPVVFTATDTSGNTATCSPITVTVNDNQDPTIICPGDQTLTASGAACSATATLPPPVVSDNCGSGGLTVTSQVIGGPSGTATVSHTFPAGPSTVRYTVTDATGNSQTCEIDVLVETGISITCPAPRNVNVDSASSCAATITGFTATVSECGVNAYTISNSRTGLSANADDTYSTTPTTHVIEFTVDDGVNTDNCFTSVTVTDNIDPVINCPITTASGTAGPFVCESSVSLPLISFTDNCGTSGGDAEITNSHTSGGASASGIYPVGTTNVLYTVTDPTGRTDTCGVAVTITDVTNPTLNCPPDQTINVNTVICSASFSLAPTTISDNCDTSALSISWNISGAITASGTGPVASGTSGQGTMLINYSVTDASGNTGTCSTNVIIDPSLGIACPADVSVNTDSGVCTANVSIAPATSDNCGAGGIVISNDFNGVNANPSGIYNEGTTQVNFNANDGTDSASCFFFVTVTDNEDPQITCPPNQSLTADPSLCAVAATIPNPTYSDNCGIVSLTNNFNGGTSASGTYPVGTTNVVYTVTDTAGRTASCNFNVLVTDGILPQITCPPDESFTITGSGSGSTTTTTATLTVSATGGSTSQSLAIPAGTVDVQVTRIQLRGDLNASFETVDFSVDGNTFASGINTGSQSCGYNDVVSVPYDISALTVPFGGGNVNLGMSVTSSVNSGIACASEAARAILTIEFTQGCSSVFTLPPATVSDNCGATIVSAFPPSFTGTATVSTTFNSGITTITYTATDAQGNSDVCTTNVNVGSQVQITSCPSDVNVNNDAGVCEALVNLSSGLAADNCATATINFSNSQTGATSDATDTYPVDGPTIVTFVADDGTTSDSCSITVTVTDNEPPTVVCPSDITVPSSTSFCQADVTVAAPTVTENCSSLGYSVFNDFNGGSTASGTFPVGTTPIIYTAVDNAGNSNTCNVNVIVQDTQDPIITCPSDVTISTSLCTTTVTLPDATFTDNCGTPGGSIVNNFNAGGADASDTYGPFPTTVTFTATDTAGLTATCSTTITIDTGLTITCPSDVVTVTDTNVCVDTLSGLVATASNCAVSPNTITNDSPYAVSSGNDASGDYPVGSHTITFTATDASETVTCTTDIIVTDNQNPTPGCTSGYTVTLNLSNLWNYSLDVSDIQTTSTDNCGIQSVSLSGDVNYNFESFLNYFNGDNFFATLTATDLDGNTNSCTTPIDISLGGLTPTCSDSVFTFPPDLQTEYMYEEFDFQWYGNDLPDDWVVDLDIYSSDLSTNYQNVVNGYRANLNTDKYIGFHQLVPNNYQIQATFRNTVNSYSYGPFCAVRLVAALRDWSTNE